MSFCVQVGLDGAIYAVDPQPVVTGSCSLVLVSGEEAGNDLLKLTAEQGSQIGVAILLVWALAFTFRMIIRSFNVDQNGDST